MSEVQEKQKEVASESEPEKVSNETGGLNAEDTVADGNNGKNKVDPSSSTTDGNSTKGDSSGSEPKTPSKNVDVETVASELVKANVDVPGEMSEGKGKIEENKLKVNNKVTTPGSKKRKIKKVLTPKNKAAKKADNATASSVKLNVQVPTVVSGDEKKAEENTKEEHKAEENTKEENKEEENKKAEENTKEANKEEENKKAENMRKRKRKKLVNKPADLVPSKDASKPESSKDKDVKKSEIKDKNVKKSEIKDKNVKKSEIKGMIFMCSSKTKQDCYNYKVFGLPANKKDTVAKIYSGMRLFLFDIDLKLLYGVYKADGPGGYNLEPNAFKSAFPSQVRFTMMEDCLPLAEENFKAVIKDNYFARNKFDCNLNGEQVRNLCKLFKETTAKAGGPSKQATEARPVVDRSRDRAQGGQDKERRKSGRDADRRRGGERDRRDSDRRKSGGGNDRYNRDRRPPAPREERREAYPLRLLPLPLPQAQTQVQQTYAYERPPVEYYRSGERSYDRQVDETLYAPRAPLDPYLHRDPVPLSYHESLYAPRVAPLEPLPPSRTYPELVYTTRVPPPESTLSYHDPVYTRDPPLLAYLPSHSAYHRY